MPNSFSITRRGSRDKVKAALQLETALPEGTPQHQIQAAIAYLLTQIDALPAEFNAVAIAANGDLSPDRSVIHNCTVQGEKLDI